MAKKLNTRARINTKLIPQHWLSLDSHRKSLTILHNLFIRYTRCSVLLSFGVDWPSSPMRTSAGHFYRADGVSCIKTKIELLPMEKLNRRDLHSTSCRWFDSSISVFIFSLLKIKTTCSVWTSGFFLYVHCTFFIHVAQKSIHYPYFGSQYSTHSLFITLNFVERSRRWLLILIPSRLFLHRWPIESVIVRDVLAIWLLKCAFFFVTHCDVSDVIVVLNIKLLNTFIIENKTY